MKKMLFSIILISLLVSCSPKNTLVSSDISIIDALGREVKFSSYPERIVIAGKQTPTIANFYYLFPSRVNRLLAIENRSQSPDKFLSLIDEKYESKLVIEKGAGVEQIAPLNPDLVILKTTMKDEIGSGLDEVGIPVIYVSFEDVESIYSDIRVLGTILDDQGRAEEIISEYQKELSNINKKVAADNTEQTALLIQVTNSENEFSFQVPAENWLQTKMVEDLQITPVWESPSSSDGWTEVNIEQVVAWAPSTIMVINYQGKSSEIVEKLKQNPIWQQFLNENNSVLEAFPYDFSSWDQPDPRWILGYGWMAYKFYPDQFSENELLDSVKNFYTFYYGLEESLVDMEINLLISPYFKINGE